MLRGVHAGGDGICIIQLSGITYIEHDGVFVRVALLAAGSIIPGEHEQAVNRSQH